MGILLIGVVAALFFRHEPVAVTEPLSTSRRQQLNQQLRNREIAVYIPDEQAAESAAENAAAAAEPRWTLGSVIRELDHRNHPSPAPLHPHSSLEEHTSNRESLDGYRTWKPHRGTASTAPQESPQDDSQRRLGAASTAAATPHVTAPRRLPPLHATPGSAPTTDGSPQSTTSSAETGGAEMIADADWDAAPESKSATPSGEFDEHTVQFGETLSSIAEHYLGSRSRYNLIFEANRDRLTSADRLQVGLKLRIPRRTATAE